MVPQYVRRRYSTMFNGQPPFAFESTDDCQESGIPYVDSKTPPPGCSYHENPFQGFAPPAHASTPPAPLSRDEVVLERLAPQEAVPAMFSPPKLSPAKVAELARQHGSHRQYTRAAAPLTILDQVAFDLMDFPALPELIDDTDSESHTTSAAHGSDDETLTGKGVRAYKFLRCTQCDCLLRWLFVKQFKDGIHQIHGCAPQSETHVVQPDGPVQVSRGAW
ncbi:hypothetical protein LTR27_012580 [Elasticomyces elasticus]|nr:hypothetical protein LTR27_012580 [Elasticomyces elasticus]